MRLVRTATCLALAGSALSASVALATEAPKTTTTSKTLYLAMEGCGTTAEAGRLEVKPQADGATGCGTVGGLPVDEAFYQVAGATPEDYTSTKSLVPFKIDATKKVTGQLAAGSWTGAGGAGTVTFDVHLAGVTSKGTGVDFGDTTVSTTVTGTDAVAYVPFELAVPASAVGATLKAFTISVVQRGANIGYSAKQLSGDSYVVIPAKKK
jgi:hypothetical protein